MQTFAAVESSFDYCVSGGTARDALHTDAFNKHATSPFTYDVIQSPTFACCHFLVADMNIPCFPSKQCTEHPGWSALEWPRQLGVGHA